MGHDAPTSMATRLANLSLPSKALEALKSSLQNSETYLSADSTLVFVCGASPNKQSPGGRDQLMEYAQKYLKNFQFFMAEKFFEVFQKEQDQDIDFLTIENKIAKYCDCIIIVLESDSTFAELGAFATNDDLTEIILAINDVRHISSKSFISLGPLAKIQKRSKFKPILHTDLRSIVTKAPEINLRLSKIKRTYGKRVEIKDYSDFTELKPKDRMYFLLDMVTMFFPITKKELISLLNYFYGNYYFDIHVDITLLSTLGFVNRINEYYVKSLGESKYFFKYYGLNTVSLRSQVINHYHKYLGDKLTILGERIKQPL